ncbi:N-carbamoylsarcosine amidohydrolase [Novosphingobium ginsenosidimutans]|uniref:Isochorismatase family protein n=1 Tax=Novosphingobium ginsenosidimutans TaxID=1176536 RepID=A0A5B8S682_9SPHN|nr:N-carbamoylsarcosine amidohydrolase [Novosphingobium ginsenosidimutans]QEA16618.1 isochorismatase family protein [Novosphingobium ginsenosidimutans]
MAKEEGDLGENYKGAFDGHLPFGKKPALLIVDFVVAYLDPASPLYAGVEDALASNERLLAAARKAGIPVLFTNVEYSPGGADGGVFYRKVPALKLFERGSPMGAFPASLQPQDGELVITKQYASSFFGTTLAATLTAMGVDTLLITGLSTSGCVRATALDACQHGFLPFVVREACGDRHPGPHEANLFDLQAKYAEVISETEAIAHISAP